MHVTRIKTAAQRGFSLVEIALVVAVLAILSGFAISAFMGSAETRDAETIQAAQVALQQVVSQGSARMDLAPSELDENNVLTAVRAAINQSGSKNAGVRFDLTSGDFQVTIDSSGRAARFEVRPSGDVVIVPNSLKNFTNYTVNSDGIITKI